VYKKLYKVKYESIKMRAQYVYESIGFVRGADPKASMGIGITKKVQSIIDRYMDDYKMTFGIPSLEINLGNFIADYFNEKNPGMELSFGSPEGTDFEELFAEYATDERAFEVTDDVFYLNGTRIADLSDIVLGDDKGDYENINASDFFAWQEKLEEIVNQKKIPHDSDRKFLKYLGDNHKKGRLEGIGKFKILKTKLYKDLSQSEIEETWKNYGMRGIDPETLMFLIRNEEGSFYGRTQWITMDNMKSSYVEDKYANKSPDEALMFSAQHGQNDLKIFREAIKAGANVNQKDSIGRSPLSYCAGMGDANKVKILLDNGADKDNSDSYGMKPIDWAINNLKSQKEYFNRKYQQPNQPLDAPGYDLKKEILDYKKIIKMLS
jgi:hypothetical protein